MSSHYKEQLVAWLSTKDITAGSVVSIGCQSDDRKYFKSFQAVRYQTLDFNPAFSPQIVHDMNRPIFTEGYEGDGNGEHDLVLALELMEYIWNPVQAMHNMADLLKAGGRLIISFPFVYPVHEPAGTDFMRFTPDGAERLLKDAGFKIIEHSYRYGGELLPQFYSGERMRARKGSDHHIVSSLIIAEKL